VRAASLLLVAVLGLASCSTQPRQTADTGAVQRTAIDPDEKLEGTTPAALEKERREGPLYQGAPARYPR
jgi:hypothetical protein